MSNLPDCLFCQIVSKQVPARIRYEDDTVVAFDDISPQAPTHILVVPKKHIPTIDDIEPADEKMVGGLIYAAQKIAREQGIAELGYRLVFNVRHHGGQVVDHIHLHILGGKNLGSMA